MIKLRRFLYLGGALLLLLVKFTFDVIGKNVELEIGGLSLFREMTVIGAFILFALLLEGSLVKREESPMRKLGILLVAMLGMLVAAMAFASGPGDGFDAKNLSLLPLDYPTLFVASLVGITFGGFALLAIRMLRDLILYQRKKGTRRNFMILVGLMTATGLSTLMMRPLDSSAVTSTLFGMTCVFALVNSFRLPWIVYLTKREKIFSLIYAFFLFFGMTGLNIFFMQNAVVSRSLLYYSYPLREFVVLTGILANIYFGMAFVSTLFHLPTADAFDRKRSEVSSLHNLSKLITQVFDFNELVETVMTMTLQVCEAKSCWIELVHWNDETPSSSFYVKVVGLKNITQDQIDEFVSPAGRSIRDTVMEDRRPQVVDDVTRDPRFRHLKKSKSPISSVVVAPLVSHAGIIGLLYATKENAFGFVKDDVDVISAFADQATVAIENSRLINKSLERERLLREMMLAQEMQRKLLPQAVPVYASLEIDAVSTPAFEVGGDYYDFVELDESTLGIVVGDVSGKGVSAAFYMSEVKGIFQSLSRMYPSPKEFMLNANNALMGSIDKHSFISLIYAILDVRTGVLRLSRAGHCPMLLVAANHEEYVRPGGMGMGLSGGEVFAGAIEERSIHLQEGDLCIFYTDGITEARRGDEEFGYDRLVEIARRTRGGTAAHVKGEILEAVSVFTDRRANDDDLTLVVLKWRGTDIATTGVTQ